MIKSSWFYVKFKYAEKVSQYVFFSPPRETFHLKPLESSYLTGSSGCWGKQMSLEILFVNVFPLA